MPASSQTGTYLLKRVLNDPTAWGLILSNIFTIALALHEGWSLATTLIVYWCQSMIIGAFNVAKILCSKDLNVRTPLSPNLIIATKLFLAILFTLHYGLFHLGCYSFLKGQFKYINPGLLIFLAGSYSLNHIFSFFHNLKSDSENQDFARLMYLPYQRIMPMHIAIMIGVAISILIRPSPAETAVLVFFLALKTLADVQMHIIEHSPGPRIRSAVPLGEGAYQETIR